MTPTIPADANIAVGNFMPYRTRNPSRNNEAETGKPAYGMIQTMQDIPKANPMESIQRIDSDGTFPGVGEPFSACGVC